MSLLVIPVCTVLAFVSIELSRKASLAPWRTTESQFSDQELRSGLPDMVWNHALQTSSSAPRCGSEANRSPLLTWMCSLQVTADSERKPKQSSSVVLVRDTSRVRYFAKRDLQAWQVAYERLGMQVVEPALSEPTRLKDFVVLICLGLAFQEDLCLRPQDQLQLASWQRSKPGLRHEVDLMEERRLLSNTDKSCVWPGEEGRQGVFLSLLDRSRRSKDVERRI